MCSASWETRKFGVRSAMPISRALRLCPDAMCVPVPRKACSEKSHEIREVLEQYAPIVSGASIDEWYLDMGGTEGVYHHESLSDTAHRIRDAVREATTLSISIGGGTNKLVAKLAVERAKPKPGTGADGVHIVAPGTEEEFLRTCTLAELPMVGPKFQERLAKLGMTTVPDVLQHDLPTLHQWFGEREGGWLWDRVHGRSESEVASEGGDSQKSMSRDETFPEDLHDDADLDHELVALVTRVAFDLRSDGLGARTITVKIRDRDFRTRSARRTLTGPGCVGPGDSDSRTGAAGEAACGAACAGPACSASRCRRWRRIRKPNQLRLLKRAARPPAKRSGTVWLRGQSILSGTGLVRKELFRRHSQETQND